MSRRAVLLDVLREITAYDTPSVHALGDVEVPGVREKGKRGASTFRVPAFAR